MTVENSDPEGLAALYDGVEGIIDAYGMGAIFAANVLGAGSIYILSQTGASTGLALLWVLPLAFALDMVMHDMSTRLAVRDRPLMSYIRDRVGPTVARAFGVSMALVMQLWAVANYAVAGYVVAWFTGFDPRVLILLTGTVAVVLLLSGTYKQIETLISVLIVVVFSVYALLTLSLNPPADSVAAGFVPSSVSDPTLVIAMLGTTVYYPNFFIQSSMRPTKEWSDISKYRRDNFVGISFTVLVSVGILTVAALTLSPGELSLVDPARPLVELVGEWTLPVFLVAVFAASFTSATGTLFASGFAVPQSFGERTVFGDRNFTLVTTTLIAVSLALSILFLAYTDLTPVRMAILMPAVNGVIYLPITIAAMFVATKDELGPKQTAITVVAVLVMIAGSLLTARSLVETISAFV